MSNFKVPGLPFSATGPYVAYPADSPKKRPSSHLPGPKPVFVAATSTATGHKHHAARKAGQKALQSVVMAQKHAQKMRHPPGSGPQMTMPDPAGLQSPSASYRPGDLPITNQQMEDAVKHLLTEPPEDVDRLVGKSLAGLLPRLAVPRQVCLASMQAVRNLCNERENMVMKQPSKSSHHPLRLKRGSKAVTATQHPVVFMDESQALHINSVTPGKPGYAYMSSPDCAGLHHMGPFHLFNRPVVGNSSPVNGGAVANERWRYCGVYDAHETSISLSKDGWGRIPDQTKRKIAETFAHVAAYDSGKSIRHRTSQEVDWFLQNLNSGVSKLPLMLFRCVAYPLAYVDAVERSDATQTVRLGRVPEPRRIDYDALRMNEPIPEAARARMGQRSTQQPAVPQADQRERAQEQARRQAQEAERNAREEEERLANYNHNKWLRDHRVLGPNRRGPAPGPQ
ncbi:hypothetical protein GY45DRAFT_343277 [Cubamyces sp. BRFM 1775]|nr:hypothetical protein GY45DRAFT_343277 [Cubamyces sp. BRFM 1775]